MDQKDFRVIHGWVDDIVRDHVRSGYRPRSGRRERVSASELAQMGVCERLVLFEYRYGQRRSAQQRKDMARGGREHRRFFREGQVQPIRKGPCFIATLVYGEGREVSALRSFRDRVLLRSMLRRGVILAYYRAAPAVCRILAGHPWLIRVMRALLRPAIWMAAGLERWRGGR